MEYSSILTTFSALISLSLEVPVSENYHYSTNDQKLGKRADSSKYLTSYVTQRPGGVFGTKTLLHHHFTTDKSFNPTVLYTPTPNRAFDHFKTNCSQLHYHYHIYLNDSRIPDLDARVVPDDDAAYVKLNFPGSEQDQELRVKLPPHANRAKVHFHLHEPNKKELFRLGDRNLNELIRSFLQPHSIKPYSPRLLSYPFIKQSNGSKIGTVTLNVEDPSYQIFVHHYPQWIINGLPHPKNFIDPFPLPIPGDFENESNINSKTPYKSSSLTNEEHSLPTSNVINLFPGLLPTTIPSPSTLPEKKTLRSDKDQLSPQLTMTQTSQSPNDETRNYETDTKTIIGESTNRKLSTIPIPTKRAKLEVDESATEAYASSSSSYLSPTSSHFSAITVKSLAAESNEFDGLSPSVLALMDAPTTKLESSSASTNNIHLSKSKVSPVSYPYSTSLTTTTYKIPEMKLEKTAYTTLSDQSTSSPLNISVLQDTSRVAIISGGRDQFHMPLESLEIVSEKGTSIINISMPVPLYDHMAVSFNNSLISCGGYSGEDLTVMSRCDQLDLTTGTWAQMPNMPLGIRDAGIVAVDEKIFVLGGWNEGPLNSVFVFNFENMKWTDGITLSVNRYSPCAVNAEGIVVVTGGADQFESGLNVNYKSVEMFDPSSSTTWTSLPAMNFARRHHACTFVQSPVRGIMVAGGSGETDKVHKSVEFLSIEEHDRPFQWNRIGSLERPRCCWPQLGVINAQLFMLSGERLPSDTVEVFDFEELQWTMSDGRLMTKRGQSRAIFLAIANNAFVCKSNE